MERGERAPSKRSVESELRRGSRWTKVSGGVSIFPSSQEVTGVKKRREKKAFFAGGGVERLICNDKSANYPSSSN